MALNVRFITAFRIFLRFQILQLIMINSINLQLITYIGVPMQNIIANYNKII